MPCAILAARVRDGSIFSPRGAYGGYLTRKVTNVSSSHSKSNKSTVAKKLYFGGLSYNTTDDTLNAAVAGHGTVSSAKVIMDRETGRSRGFGFVEMSTDDEADAVLKALDGQEIDGRMVRVSVARPPENGGGGGRGGGFGGGRGGGGFGGGERRQSW